jgi:hypothetical protein
MQQPEGGAGFLKYLPDNAAIRRHCGYNTMAEVFINNERFVLQADQQNWLTNTLGHEFRHITYKLENLYNQLRWKVLRDSFNNGLFPGMLFGASRCSAGLGHEQSNPEDQAVCRAGGQ